MDRDALNAQLEALKQMYLTELPPHLDTIKRLARQLEGNWGHELAKELVKEIHSLAGAAGSFGFPELSQLAREVEQGFKPILADRTATQVPKDLDGKIKEIYTYLDEN